MMILLKKCGKVVAMSVVALVYVAGCQQSLILPHQSLSLKGIFPDIQLKSVECSVWTGPPVFIQAKKLERMSWEEIRQLPGTQVLVHVGDKCLELDDEKLLKTFLVIDLKCKNGTKESEVLSHWSKMDHNMCSKWHTFIKMASDSDLRCQHTEYSVQLRSRNDSNKTIRVDLKAIPDGPNSDGALVTYTAVHTAQ